MAFEVLVRKYDRKVLGLAFRFSGSREDAQDIYQEVFLRAYSALPKFRFESLFSTWLYRITANICLSRRSSVARHDHIPLDEVGGSGAAVDWAGRRTVPAQLKVESESEQVTFERELGSRVRDAVSKLSPQQRLIFAMRHFQELKLRDIEEILKCAEGTVKKHLFEGVRRLREELQQAEIRG